MATDWMNRAGSSYPYQEWNPFPPNAIVQISGYDRRCTKIGPAKSFWWGWASGLEAESVIRYARRLDTPKQPKRVK